LDHKYCQVASAAQHEKAGGAIRAHVENAERWVVEDPLIAAWKDSPVLRYYPVDFHYIHDDLRPVSRADAINGMLKHFRAESERFGWSRPWLPKACALPR
jgi:hypothetical protein